ncbi:MAG: hypothetical protein JNL12_20135 [Planctomycetes bacterium]|nr:hypothetical protein [Planctomycetota bacterium]
MNPFRPAIRSHGAPRARLVAAVLPGLLAVSVPVVLPRSLAAQSPFASLVVSSNTNGNAGGGIFDPTQALGAPLGATHVHSLGIGGALTLEFTPPIVDRPGADLMVAENPFRLAGNETNTFAEVAFVEVSSNGVDFVRFPARYFGAPSSPGAFGTMPVGAYANLAGQTPMLATSPGADPLDLVEAGGDAFDLGDLLGESLVVAGLVDLQAVRYVRLVDVPSGAVSDSVGATIFDAGSGSADIDAVTAVHQQGPIVGSPPNVAMTILTDGTIGLRIEDPDGASDLDPSSLRVAVFGLPLADPLDFLTGAFLVVGIDANGYTLVQPFPIPDTQLFTFTVSVKDLAGNRSGQSRTRPLP